MCEHLNHFTNVDIGRLIMKSGKIRYTADIRINCSDCGTPFRWLGLSAGVDLEGAAVSVDGEEGRFSIAPQGEVLPAIEGVKGFTIRKEESEK